MDIDEFRSIALFEGLTDDELAQCTEPLKEFEMVAGSSLAKQDDFASRAMSTSTATSISLPVSVRVSSSGKRHSSTTKSVTPASRRTLVAALPA
jgi:hypothetical protein